MFWVVLWAGFCSCRTVCFSMLLLTCMAVNRCGRFQNPDLVAVKRMYLALVLFSLLKETNVWSVAERFQLSRGFVQTLLSSASAFCSCVLHFTEVRLVAVNQRAVPLSR